MSQFYPNLIFSNGACQSSFIPITFNLLRKGIKTIIEQNDFWLSQQRVRGAKRVCFLCLGGNVLFY